MRSFKCKIIYHLLAILVPCIAFGQADRTINLKNDESYHGIFEVNGEGSEDWRAGVVLCTHDAQKNARISRLNQGLWPVITFLITNGQPASGSIRTFNVSTERAEKILVTCSL